ncbi:hypothetical protein [Pedobacter sp. BMA]|uniref:hypothetical protein n=1 Tax=Pedobacter sp. BMA TaxID=1663685 RepID=UPI0006498863|nr:hypothetical protein [Pedobacter sp. BMA]KLT66614.1 hypothetical protein AB669_05415 [Pedobacter sp. BMA]
MKSIIITIIHAVLLFLAFPVLADTGCLINTSAGPKVYYVPQFSGTTTFYQGSGTVRYGNQASCQAGNSPSNSYYILTSAAGPTCYAGYDGSGATNDGANYQQSGNRVTFNVANCPLDDYIPLLIIFAGFLGLFGIRRRYSPLNF